MNIILRSVLINHVVGFSHVVLRESFTWDWNLHNTCGPRPQGPHYPYPPATNGSYMEPGKCDIIDDEVYIFNYECETNCQTDSSKTIKLICNCLVNVGPVERTVPCKWEYEADESCEVPTDSTFDWECDPRDGTCPEGQYIEDVPEDESTNPYGMFNWQTGYGNFSAMQGGMPGYINHIYISPTMVQNSDGESHGHVHADSNNTYASPEYDPEYPGKLLEAEEKTRGMKSRIREMAKAFEREREQYKVQNKALENQIKIMQELLRYNMKEDDSLRHSPRQSDSSVITFEHQNTNSETEMLNDSTAEFNTQSMENEKKEEVLDLEEPNTIIERNNSSRPSTGKLRTSKLDKEKLNDPIANIYTQLNRDAVEDQEPLVRHMKKKLRTVRGRVEKLKNAIPSQSSKKE